MLANRVRMGSGGGNILEPGNIVGYEDNREVTYIYGGSFSKRKSVIVNASGVIRLTYNVLNYGPSGESVAEIRVNEVMVDSLKNWNSTYVSKSIDIEIKKGAEISLYLGATVNGPRERNNLFRISLNKTVPEGTFVQTM